jgi:hypothetical protein
VRGLAVLIFVSVMASASSAFAQIQPPQAPVACKPCWIEPWYCKAPPCPPTPVQPKPTPRPDADPARPGLVHETLTGIVRSLGVVQEEPAETPQASFYLMVRGPNGRTVDVLVSLPAQALHCSEGELATLEGDVAAADRDMPTLLMQARTLSCGPAPDAR